MPIKLRPVQFTINVSMVQDDGENLTPVQVPEIVINADKIHEFYEKFKEDIEAQEELLNAHAEAESTN